MGLCDDREVSVDCLIRSGPITLQNCFLLFEQPNKEEYYLFCYYCTRGKGKRKPTQKITNERRDKSMLGSASYLTVENGSKMKQKLNIGNTNSRGRMKKNSRDEQHRILSHSTSLEMLWPACLITCVGTKAPTKKNKSRRRININ